MSLLAAGGYWLDDRWGTDPWLVIVGAVLGFVVGFRHLLQMAEQSNRRGSTDEKREKR
jgi:F0F1-type ATP synthase assembly protein I